MSRKLTAILLITAVLAMFSVINACTPQQQAENTAINAIDATADAARMKVNQFVGYTQALVDQLADLSGGGPIATARANEISYALDDVDAAFQAIINATEDNRLDALTDAQKSVDKAIETVRSVADEAESPKIQQRLNEMADELEKIREALVTLINEQSK
jgi:ABC-type transporter Mla subunit MlaD